MEQYNYRATVERTVVDTISLTVRTDKGSEDARAKAEEVLASFPSNNKIDYVPYCYIENRQNLKSKIVGLDRMIPTRIVDEET